MPMKRVPPRLFVIKAAEANVAMIFRRGPSQWFHILRWNLLTDYIESGAWIKGRIYPEKCDVSPDGSLLLYFIHKGTGLGSKYSDAWSALSRLPWLYALGLWPQHTTCGGGGRFTGNSSGVLRSRNVEPLNHHPGYGFKVVSGSPPLHESEQLIHGAEWSGRQSSTQIIYAKHGKLFRITNDNAPKLVADLNPLEPKPTKAPKWARTQLVSGM